MHNMGLQSQMTEISTQQSVTSHKKLLDKGIGNAKWLGVSSKYTYIYTHTFISKYAQVCA